MVFESTDSPFSCIAAVNMRRRQLIIDVLFDHELLYGCRGFVVKPLELWGKSTGREKSNSSLVGCKNIRAVAGFDRNRLDTVRIIIVQDKHIGITRAGRSEEATGLNGEDLASDGLTINIKFVGAGRWEGLVAWWIEVVVVRGSAEGRRFSTVGVSS